MLQKIKCAQHQSSTSGGGVGPVSRLGIFTELNITLLFSRELSHEEKHAGFLSPGWRNAAAAVGPASRRPEKMDKRQQKTEATAVPKSRSGASESVFVWPSSSELSEKNVSAVESSNLSNTDVDRFSMTTAVRTLA